MSNIIRSWNGRTIRQREDGYLCLTDMAQATGKRVQDWTDLKTTNSYLVALGTSVNIVTDQLVCTIKHGLNEQRGTWGHRKVAIRFAQWCSDEFANFHGVLQLDLF